MIIYTGTDRVIWAVTRTGPGEDQFAAITDRDLIIWNQGVVEPAQVIPCVNEGRVHADLVSSPDGQYLASVGAGHLWCWKHTPKGWAEIPHDLPRTVAVAGFSGPDTLEVVTIHRQETNHQHIQSRRLRCTPKQLKPEQIVELPATDELDDHRQFYDAHYMTMDVSAVGQIFLLSLGSPYQHLWNTAAGEYLGQVKLRSVPNEGCLSPDGAYAAIDAGTTIYVYRVAGLELVSKWKVKHCYSPQLAWSPDGTRILRADASTTIRQYDWAQGAEVSALSLNRHRVTAVRYSPDGLTYIAGTFKGPVVVWDVE